jgi:CHAT domain
MIEDRAEFYSKAALRLLDLGRPEPAFEILERARARGLAELIALGERGDVGPGELSFLSKLLHLEAMASRSQKALKDRALQHGALDANDPSLDELSHFENDRLAFLRRHPQILKKLAGSAWSPVRLPELQAKAAIAGTSVLLYWIQRDGLVVWHVGPGGSMVRAVFLPQVLLREKVERLRRSAERSSESFDAMVARELYLYLIAPMKPQLAEHLMIVPHGELLGLPFETLINPDTGRYLIEEAEVVYAPNASHAVRTLAAPPVRLEQAVAVVDQTIDIRTNEIEGMRAGLGGDKVREVDVYQLTSSELKAGMAGADMVHLLVHGRFAGDEPLLSMLILGLVDRPRSEFYATDLLDLPIDHAKLAVLSACESGEIKGTIANEIYGLPWVLLIAGVPTVVLSRWRVDAEATGRWMSRFYATLAQGASPGQATALAMRGQLAEAATAHPYYWAGPQITGR